METSKDVGNEGKPRKQLGPEGKPSKQLVVVIQEERRKAAKDIDPTESIFKYWVIEFLVRAHNNTSFLQLQLDSNEYF